MSPCGHHFQILDDPTSFRRTLVKPSHKLCKTREQFKAWSQFLARASVVTATGTYCHVSNQRQAELIRNLG